MSNEEKADEVLERVRALFPMLKQRLGSNVENYADFFRQSLINMAEWKAEEMERHQTTL